MTPSEAAKREVEKYVRKIGVWKFTRYRKTAALLLEQGIASGLPQAFAMSEAAHRAKKAKK